MSARLLVRKPFNISKEKSEAIAKRGIPKRVCPSCWRKFTPNDRFPDSKYCDSHCEFAPVLKKN